VGVVKNNALNLIIGAMLDILQQKFNNFMTAEFCIVHAVIDASTDGLDSVQHR